MTRAPTSVDKESDFVMSAGLGAQISWNDILFAPNLAVQEHGGYAADLDEIEIGGTWRSDGTGALRVPTCGCMMKPTIIAASQP